jgi:TonB family protein
MRSWILPAAASLTLHVGVLFLFVPDWSNEAEEVSLVAEQSVMKVTMISSYQLDKMLEPPEVVEDVTEFVKPEIVEEAVNFPEITPDPVVVSSPTALPIPMPERPVEPTVVTEPPVAPPPPPPPPEPVPTQIGNSNTDSAEIEKIDGEIKADFARHFRYPSAARRSGIQATVMMQFVVNPDGSITNIKIMNDVPEILERAAIKSLMQVNVISTPVRATTFKLSVNYKLQ